MIDLESLKGDLQSLKGDLKLLKRPSKIYHDKLWSQIHHLVLETLSIIILRIDFGLKCIKYMQVL